VGGCCFHFQEKQRKISILYDHLQLRYTSLVGLEAVEREGEKSSLGMTLFSVRLVATVFSVLWSVLNSRANLAWINGVSEMEKMIIIHLACVWGTQLQCKFRSPKCGNTLMCRLRDCIYRA
jgi:hypothetical protein